MRGPFGLQEARAALEDEARGAAWLWERAARRNRELDEGPRPVRAFLCTAEETREEAEGPGLDPGRRGDPGGLLAGIPVAVKDNLCTADLPTTCASRALAGYRPPYDATAVRRLRAAGARLFGKTNLDEFAMGSSTETGAFGVTRNPIDRSRTAGGSSGGSAAAVAAGVTAVALGSDTGGSVRQPAAFCGVVGLRPTYGRVSRYGLVAFSSSLDQVGILATRVADAARVLEAIAGPDPRDATCRDLPPPRAAAATPGLRGRTLGVPRKLLAETEHDPRVGAAFERALEVAAGAGARVREVSIPSAPGALPCYYVLASAEASSNLARYDGVRYGGRVPAGEPAELYARTRGEGFGAEVKRRILIGTHVLSARAYEAYYGCAARLRDRIASEMRAPLEAGIDALFTPTAPTPAFRLGEEREDPYERYRTDAFTVAASLAGLPAVSVPIGDADGLPVGGQLVGPAFGEERLLGLATGLERALGYEHPLEGGAEGSDGGR